MPNFRHDERRSQRRKVMLAASLDSDGTRKIVRVLDMSASGALIKGHLLPKADAPVVIRLGAVVAEGWVAWVRGQTAGIQYVSELLTNPLMRRVENTSNMVVEDRRPLSFRRPGFRGNQLTEQERRFIAQITEEEQTAICAQ